MSVKENKRLEIIRAAIRVFSQDGFHKAKMEDIAKEAGIGKGTIYEYFESKKDLFQEMIMYSIDLYKEKAEEIVSDKDSARSKLIAYAEFHGRFIANHIDAAQLAIVQSQILSIDMKRFLMEGRIKTSKIIREIVEEGIQSGELRKDLDIDTAVSIIIGTINQTYAQKLFFDKMSAKDVNAQLIVDTLFKGLA